MIGRKGQGAMEYLMTYGWAILVVMIVGVVLWQLGIFGGGPGAVNTASGFGKIKPMEPSIKFTAGASGDLSFSIMNGVGQAVRELNYTATGDCTQATQTLISGGTLNAGEVDSVSLGAANCNDKTAGQSFSTVLTIRYATTVAGNDVTHVETGTIRGVAE